MERADKKGLAFEDGNKQAPKGKRSIYARDIQA
jgi:hypothetical protein